MKNIIEKFYYGELRPCEMPAPTYKKYKDTITHLSRLEAEILQKFPEVKEMLEEYRDLLQQISSMESANDFSRGFRIGAFFMSDILSLDGKE